MTGDKFMSGLCQFHTNISGQVGGIGGPNFPDQSLTSVTAPTDWSLEILERIMTHWLIL